MTTTERLRKLLDKRGVEHVDHEDNATWWSNGNVECAYIQGMSDELGHLSFIASPEQAIEATLDRGTCAKVREWEGDPCGGGGWVLVCSECDEFLANDGEDGKFDGPNFCPNCGRRIMRGEV